MPLIGSSILIDMITYSDVISSYDKLCNLHKEYGCIFNASNIGLKFHVIGTLTGVEDFEIMLLYANLTTFY